VIKLIYRMNENDKKRNRNYNRERVERLEKNMKFQIFSLFFYYLDLIFFWFSFRIYFEINMRIGIAYFLIAFLIERVINSILLNKFLKLHWTRERLKRFLVIFLAFIFCLDPLINLIF
jgi:hypothetical protein